MVDHWKDSYNVTQLTALYGTNRNLDDNLFLTQNGNNSVRLQKINKRSSRCLVLLNSHCRLCCASLSCLLRSVLGFHQRLSSSRPINPSHHNQSYSGWFVDRGGSPAVLEFRIETRSRASLWAWGSSGVSSRAG